MGLFSWLRPRRRRHLLVIVAERDDSDETPVQHAAAEDVARIREDDKYFGKGSPGDDYDF
jgi:hypothetical protein